MKVKVMKVPGGTPKTVNATPSMTVENAIALSGLSREGLTVFLNSQSCNLNDQIVDGDLITLSSKDDGN